MKRTKAHNKKISEAMKGNDNVLGKHWSWNDKSKKNRRTQWKGKTWSSKTQFKKGQVAWNKGKKMPKSMRNKVRLSLLGKTGHHIDYNKYNCNEENLITACRSCNAKFNAKKYRESVTTLRERP